MFAMFIGSPILGEFSDHFGRKRMLIFALIGVALCSLLSAYAVIIRSVYLLIASRFFIGFVDGSESIAMAAITDLSKGSSKVINMSMITLSGGLGFVIGPIVGAYLSDATVVSWFSYQTPFLVSSVFMIINAIALYFLFNETFVVTQEHRVDWLRGIRNLLTAFKSKTILQLSLVFFCIQFAWGMVFQSASLLLVSQLHYTTEKIGFYMQFIAVVFMLALLIVVPLLLKVLKPKKIVLVALPLIVFGGVLLYLFPSKLMIWLSIIPVCMGVGMSYNNMLAILSDEVSKDHQGRMMGLSVAVIAIAWGMSGLLAGPLSVVGATLPYLFAAISAFVGFIMMWRYVFKG